MKNATRKKDAGDATDVSAPIRFHTTILTAGKTATGIQIPNEVMAKLGTSKRPAVRITMNGYTYRSTVAVMGGRFMVGVNAENREKANVAGGQEIDVDIELDTEPREVVVPADFATALRRNAKAQKHFDGLSYSQRKAFALGVEGAKTEETRRRRIEKAVADLIEAARR